MLLLGDRVPVLVDMLKGQGLFTVFAPTDDAFAARPEGSVESLLPPEHISQLNRLLKNLLLGQNILKYREKANNNF